MVYLPFRIKKSNPLETVNTTRSHRKRFTILTFLIAIALVAWGAFVTSINAGMAVPDWPSSFNSYDPFNPWPDWWTITPVLAEHGHRLLGALVGLFTLALAIWTWFAEDRPWMKKVAIGALILVMLQGLLGGLRVVWVSIDLAVIHAMVAQLFFALLASMIVFTSSAWEKAGMDTDEDEIGSQKTFSGLRTLIYLAPAMVYVQIFLGALLRHPGTGIDPLFAGLHMAGAFLATGIVVTYWSKISSFSAAMAPVKKAAFSMMGVLTVQVLLGLFAYLVLLDESGMVKASNVQVIANTSHMVIGALLFATTVSTSVLCLRLRRAYR